MGTIFIVYHQILRIERTEAQVFCIAQIDTEGDLDDAYKSWFTGLASQGQDNIQV